MKKCVQIIVIIISVIVLQACNEREAERQEEIIAEEEILLEEEEVRVDLIQDQEELDLSQYSMKPHEWGEFVTGVKTRLDTSDQVVALTFDACGGPYGNQYDQGLIDFLVEESIPATLFINKRWIDENEEIFHTLSRNSLFQIENHGTEHLPLSVNGGTAWGIRGTSTPDEVYAEVMGNQERIMGLTGRAPTLFRAGTAFYDEVAVQIVNDIGLEVVNFDILGDAGATFTANQVKQSLLSSKSGSIVLLHMNQPQSGTREGVKQAIPLLQEQGFNFVLLSDYELK